MASDSCSLIIVLVLCALWLVSLWQRQYQIQPDRAAATRERLLTPRTPDDCPACRHQTARPSSEPAPPSALRPWRECKSRRGAPRRIATDGFACPTRACAYYRLTDAEQPALVGDGTHGKHERIQTFRCQAGGVTCSTRRDTPL